MKLLTGVALCAAALLAAEKKVQMADLPAAVRATVQEQTKDATLLGLSKESENGKTVYEAETKRNGKARDVLIDSSGAVIEVEEETDMAALPAPARDAIQKKAGAAKITRVEALSKNGALVAYEAAVQKGKKSSEIAVTPAGLPYKD